jgi:hypothetical protein
MCLRPTEASGVEVSSFIEGCRQEQRGKDWRVFLWEEKLVVPLIATPNVDIVSANRRQTRKANKLGYMLRA